MSIYQTLLYVCDICGDTQATTEEAFAYSDPVIDLPQGWSYTDKAGDPLHSFLTCPKHMAPPPLGIHVVEQIKTKDELR